MKKLFASLASLLVIVSVMGARPSDTVAPFTMTLSRSGDVWAATCDSGCAWITAEVTCPDTCRVLIDASGVSPDVQEAKTRARFGFVVSRDKKSWQAESLAGTAWAKIGWGCGAADPCRARITEVGVSPLDPVRN
jgi:hypothetical protein